MKENVCISDLLRFVQIQSGDETIGQMSVSIMSSCPPSKGLPQPFSILPTQTKELICALLALLEPKIDL